MQISEQFRALGAGMRLKVGIGGARAGNGDVARGALLEAPRGSATVAGVAYMSEWVSGSR